MNHGRNRTRSRQHNRALRWLRSTHGWLGAIIAVMVLLVAVTAILLAHPAALKLGAINVPSGWLPGYRTTAVPPPHLSIKAMLAAEDGRQYVGTRHGLFVYESKAGLTRVVELEGKDVFSIDEREGRILVGTRESLWMLEGGGWRMLAPYAGAANFGADGSIAISERDNLLVSSDLGESWHAADEINRALAAAPVTRSVTLRQLALDIHTGKAFVGADWEWAYIDIVSLALVFMLVSGIVIWPVRLRQRKRRQRRRQDTAHPRAGTGSAAGNAATLGAVAVFVFLGVVSTASVAGEASADLDVVVVYGSHVGESYDPIESAPVTRLDVPLADLPLSMQSVSRTVMEDQLARDLSDVLRNVSGISTYGSAGNVQESFIIRGFRADDRRNYFRNGVRFSNRLFNETSHLQRVEVLKGPASILFGAVEPGGVINLVSRMPGARPSTAVRVEGGSNDFHRAHVSRSGPLNDSASLRYGVDVSLVDSGSFRDFVENERVAVTPVLTWYPAPSTSLTLEASYLYDARTPDAGIIALGRAPADVPHSRFLGNPNDRDKFNNYQVGARFEHGLTADWTLRSRLHAGHLRQNKFASSVEPVNRGDPDDRPFFAQPDPPDGPLPLIFRQLFDNEVETAEAGWQIDLSGVLRWGRVNHHLLFGIDLGRYNEDELRTGQNVDEDPLPVGPIDLFDPFPGYQFSVTPGGSPGSFRRDWNVREDVVGVHLQDLIALSDRWKLLVGLRYDHARQRTRNNSSGERVNARSDDAVTPRVGVVFQPLATLSVYSSHSQSFSPQIGTIFPDESVEPERARQTEAGMQARWLDGRLQSTVALYQIDRRDVVVTDPERSAFRLQVGAQRSRGAEVDVVGQLAQNWRLIASYAFTDATVREDTRFESGNRLDNVPKHSAGLWSRYDLSGAPLSGLGVGAGMFFTGRRQGDLDNSFELPSYLRMDAAVYYQQGRLRAALNIKNLLNSGYFENAWRRDRIMPGIPRSVFLSVGAEW